jgi:hypothetical protein
MRRNEKQMADKAVGLNYESGLSMMTQPLGWWSSTTGVTKPGVVCKFAVLRVTKRDEARFASISVVQRASGPRRRLNILKKPRGSGRLGNDGRADVQSGGKYDFILSDATLSTQTAMSTNSTTILYTEESKTEYKKPVTHTITHSSSTTTSRRFLFNGRFKYRSSIRLVLTKWST